MGTGLRATGWTCTGIACAAGAAGGSVFLQPAARATANPAMAYTGTRRVFRGLCNQCTAYLLEKVTYITAIGTAT
jgi:hypothetical protein